MSSPNPPKQGKKRANDGEEKARDSSMTESQRSPSQNHTPQPNGPASPSIPESNEPRKLRKPSPMDQEPQRQHAQNQPKDQRHKTPDYKKQKMQRLPNNAKITKRPIHRPAIPTPFSSSASPKTLYITTTSPFIPAVKRIRALLLEIDKRDRQSQSSLKSLKSNGRLNNKDVEKAIVEGGGEKSSRGRSAECVYVKATGRAIPRALEIGVHFQREVDCVVRVELGSVSAIDDIELRVDGQGKQDGGVDAEGGEVQMMDVDGGMDESGRKKRGKKTIDESDVPETRIRTMSAVSVAISLK